MAQNPDANGYALVDSLPEEETADNSADYEDDSQVHLASLVEKKRLWWRNAVINTAFIASWFLFATVLSVYNKWMFSPDHFGFPSPLFVTTLHMFVQFLLATILRVAWPRQFRPEQSPSRADYLRRAIPTGITTGLDIGLSNLSLKLITLSFYTMCKSSSLIFVLLFAFLFHLEHFSLRLIGVIALIFAGVLLMVATETHFVLPGFLLVMSGSALGGFRWSLTQLLLRNKKMGFNNPPATVFWLAPIMGVTLAITTVFVDGWSRIFSNAFFDGASASLRTCLFLISPGVLAFCMVLSEFYILQRAGVVPMSIAGIAKEVTTISISAWFFGDELTPLNITGVAITVCGIALYTFHKYRLSMDAKVPLDAHGNPIVEDTESSAEETVALQDDLSDEGLRHTSEPDARSGLDSHPEQTSLLDRDLLFDVGSDGGAGSPDANEDDTIAKPKDAELAAQYLDDQAQDLHRVWKRDADAVVDQLQ
ncbi:TPT-domain-containing protein [Laetiporus sulphureus 93-53]|uniref:TPT-domain-containing protein n=1 Tax=Laetiporus sulphureus 93-53 TaxID=1314785 RepID=A0A165F5Q3_9APHY|nr:TPT-domain-containing protein [Laetiporus sulphureus 93-53]KZT08442.1 TPT-domain-containing protein [Laetiporus sulphureus 93-53]